MDLEEALFSMRMKKRRLDQARREYQRIQDVARDLESARVFELATTSDVKWRLDVSVPYFYLFGTIDYRLESDRDHLYVELTNGQKMTLYPDSGDSNKTICSFHFLSVDDFVEFCKDYHPNVTERANESNADYARRLLSIEETVTNLFGDLPQEDTNENPIAV